MSNQNEEFADTIAKKCFELYEILPKTGKPSKLEWTIMSSIVQSIDGNLDVVSLGTGSKCIGYNQMNSTGYILNDSHAEVMARRGFLRYLYKQIEFAHKSEESIFFVDDHEKCSLKPDVNFHFFSTQLPCGDASIIDNDNDLIHEADVPLNFSKRKNDCATIDTNAKKLKMDAEGYIYKTGAKVYSQSINYVDHLRTGQLRTKPGRGDPTLSLSCSDKLARWIRVGLQGSLLQILLSQPITVSSIIIGGGCPFSKSSLYRAIIDRTHSGILKENWENEAIKSRPIILPKLEQSKISFKNIKMDQNEPSPSSIVWCKVNKKPIEVSIYGRKQGSTKKNAKSISSSLLISKRCLFTKFISIIKTLPSFNNLITQENFHLLTYKYFKSISEKYNTEWDIVKKTFFDSWPSKPIFLDFTADK